MKRLRDIAVALSLALGAAPALTVLTPVAQAAEQQNKITTRAVAVALKKAQDLMGKKQWDPALAEIKKAQAVENKTPFEAYQIDEFLGYVLLQQKKYGEAAPVFERMLNSGFLPSEKVDDITKTVAQLYFQVQNDRKAAEWARKWLDKHPSDIDMGVLLGQAYYRMNDYKNAASSMIKVVSNAERVGRKPEENWLLIVLSSQHKSENDEGVGEALKKLVRHYPKPQYWENLLDIYRRKDTSERVQLGYYRLMDEVGILKNKDDYMEFAQLAMEAGVPGEALRVVQQGFDNGTLKVDDKTEQGRYDRLLAAAKKQVAQDEPTLPQLAKEAERASQGQPDVGLGHAYLSYGKYNEAIAAFQRGLKKGGVTDPDEAQIAMGIAHLRAGQEDQARQAFAAVKDGSRWKQLSELWQLHLQAS
jgi:tetratricopeptide (TPR) repeat protein